VLNCGTLIPTNVHATCRNVCDLPPQVEDWPLAAIELYQERFAIIQFDGGLPESEARRAAEEEVRAKWRSGVGVQVVESPRATTIINAVAPLLETAQLRVLLSAQKIEAVVATDKLRIRIACQMEPDTIRMIKVEEIKTPEDDHQVLPD
jgi:hypothetical protein